MRLLPALSCLVLALWALGSPAQVAAPPTGIRLDISADWEPVLCGGRLHVFSTEGRNQILSAGDAAPQCNPMHMTPALQPVCTDRGTAVLDGEGNLWFLGEGFPKVSQSGLGGAVALWPEAGGAALLFKDHLERADGRRLDLPFEASAGNPLSDGGCWVRGASEAARIGPAGDLRWRWRSPAGSPGPAALGMGRLIAGTSVGQLWSLDDASGKKKFVYRGGGTVVSPPRVWDDLVIYASTDHFVRAIRIKDGQLAWQFRGSGRPAFGPYRVKAGVLVAEAGGSRLVLLAPKTGKVAWTWTLPTGALLKAPGVSETEAAALAWDEVATPVLYTVALPDALPAPVERGKAP